VGDASAQSGSEFALPSLSGRHVYLRPLMPEDSSLLRAAELSPQLGVRWRYRGSTPSPEQWAQTTWNSALAQFLVIRKKNHEPEAFVCAYGANFQDGYAHFAVEALRTTRPAPLTLFGSALFIEYVFNCWNFRKLYLEAPEYNLGPVLSGMGRLFDVEARLKEHIWYGGRYWDALNLALYRRTWERESHRLLRGSKAPPAARVTIPRRKTIG
jgi:hypothetical protein